MHSLSFGTEVQMPSIEQSADVRKLSKNNNWGFIIAQPRKYLVTHLLLWSGMLLYYVLIASKSPISLLIITIMLNIIVQILMVILGRVDPGKMPKIQPTYEHRQLSQIPIDQKYENGEIKDKQMIYLFPTKTHTLKIKFCKNCMIFRPARCVHCYECNACIQRFDHHCPWMGTCIGKNNYNYFFFCITCLTIMCLLVILQTILCLIKYDMSNELGYFIMAIFLLIYDFLVCFFLIILLGFHIHLISQNLTTNEVCKKTWSETAGNPFFKKNCFKNLFTIFCRRPKKTINKLYSDYIKREILNLTVEGDELIRTDKDKGIATTINQQSISEENKRHNDHHKISIDGVTISFPEMDNFEN